MAAMAEDFAQWLNDLGLGQYAQPFADNAIDLETLPHLSDDDLKELGLPLGHRRKLQAAIGALAAGEELSRPTPPPDQDHAPQSSEAECCQLTVLFCDLVGSTELSVRLDPEDMRDVLLAYQNACTKVIARYDGYVAKFMGDGVYA
jgi:hypothetical protein